MHLKRVTFSVFVALVAMVIAISFKDEPLRSWSEIALHDFFSEMAMTVLAGSWVVFLHTFSISNRVFWWLYPGFTLIVIASLEDALEEWLFMQPLSLQLLENLGFPTGMLLVSIGLFFWGREQRQSRRHFQILSQTDALTGLGNRAAFDRQLGVLADQEGERALLVLDVDDFKPINDTYGHATGDEVIRQLAQVIRDNIRERDSAFRYGGEEFTILLRNLPVEALTQVAERIRRSFAALRFEGNGLGAFSRTISIGMVHVSGPVSADQWFDEADRYLYEAKAAGKNCTIDGVLGVG